ncbi:Hypothetical predicted protein [Paramuricea clavata]|uniref:Uncharacterized protein n=1 Tax=Paramuricea clavata TaxID=317549 RepID=A0A6S7II42_PARCT|nr:Hypothetical predicted protein [Paramuricea clavata]
MEVKDQTKVAECFVEYFTKIACEIGDPELLELFEEQLYDYKSVESIRNHKEIDNSPKFRFGKVRQDEVQLALENLKVSKSCGYDGLPNRLLKLISGPLAPSLTQMFNACIQDNYWPVQWKKGEWVPIYKKENPRAENSYRPITVLSAVGKVFEQLIGKQLTDMEPKLENNLTAYRKKNSCETSLIKLVEDWKISLDNKTVVGVLTTDLSKAFDSLHPPLLLAKLKAYDLSEDRGSSYVEKLFY